MPKAKKDKVEVKNIGNDVVDGVNIKPKEATQTSGTSSKQAVTKAYPKVKASESKQAATKTKAYPKVKVKEIEPKPTTITRVNLAQEVCKAVGQYMEITNRDSENIVTEIINAMIDALKTGDEVEVRGFGSFRIRTREARKGRNPKNGDSVTVPSKQVVYFKQGKDLKQYLMGK